MSQVVKTIKGRKYTYEVKWDPQQKKQIWTYQGKVEKKIDHEKLKRELYSAIMRHARVQKKDRNNIMKAIQEVLAKYVYYYLKSNYFQNQKNRLCSGATQKAINISKLKKITFPLPPIDYQRKMIMTLERIEKIKQWREESDKLMNDYLKSIFWEIFGDPINNPKRWNIITLKEMCNEIVDCPHSTPRFSQVTTKYPCIRTSELKNGYIDWSSMKYLDEKEYGERVKRLIPYEGDIVYGREGTFGEAVIIPKDVKMSLGQRVMLFRPNKKLSTSEFLWSLIRSDAIYRQALRSTSGSTVGHVNIKDIIRFKGINPPGFIP